MPPQVAKQRRCRPSTLRTLRILIFLSLAVSTYDMFTSVHHDASSDRGTIDRLEESTVLSSYSRLLSQAGKNISRNPPTVVHTLADGTNVTFHSNVTHFYMMQRRSDRTGGAIFNYFLAHAFAFRFHRHFGACGSVPIEEPFLTYRKQHYDILNKLGFLSKDVISLSDDCPPSNDEAHSLLLPSSYYNRWRPQEGGGMKLLTQEWIHHMRQRSPFLLQYNKKALQKTIVAHIRRGDVDPCDKYTEERYLPNSYYLKLIQKYRTKRPDHRVIIHSEAISWEGWSEFEDDSASIILGRNVEMKIGAAALELWSDLIGAEVAILSKSSYSQAPALFARGTVLCAPIPWCHEDWKQVDFDTLKEAKEEVKRLQRDKCPTLFDSRVDLNWTERVKRMGGTTV